MANMHSDSEPSSKEYKDTINSSNFNPRKTDPKAMNNLQEELAGLLHIKQDTNSNVVIEEEKEQINNLREILIAIPDLHAIPS